MGEIIRKKGLKPLVAKVLNAVGCSTVWCYDVTVFICHELCTTMEKISEHENQNNYLHLGIKRKYAKGCHEDAILEPESLKKQFYGITDEYENQIKILKLKNKEMIFKGKIRKKKSRKSTVDAKPKINEIQDKVTIQQIDKVVKNSIRVAVKKGAFKTPQEEKIFLKVAKDFLENEMEIKCLAAIELRKIGNEAAIPILMDAVKYGGSDLVSEIINSCTALDDIRAIPLFIKKVESPNSKVRIGCLRGIFKLADDDVCMSILIKSLKDSHPDVRRTALTLIEWKKYEDAVPFVIQCLMDEEAKVRKTAVLTLANLKNESSVFSLIEVLEDKDLEIREKALDAIISIAGEKIDFDVNVTEKQLLSDVLRLKQWWRVKRMAGRGVDDEIEIQSDKMEKIAAKDSKEESVISSAKLMRKTKAELINICRERNNEFDDTNLTKKKLVELIQGASTQKMGLE